MESALVWMAPEGVTGKEIMEVVTLKPDQNGKQRVIERLEELLVQARRGEIMGIIYGLELDREIAYGKANLTYPTALGILNRVAHAMNKEWDRYLEA